MTTPRTGASARDTGLGVQTHYAKFDYTNMGSTLNIGDVPPCLVTEIYVSKTVDFNSQTTATVSVGINYSDSTSDVTTALISAYDLSSSTALGPLEVTQVDSAAWKIDVASTLTLTLAQTGTSATTGVGYAVVHYVPDAMLKDLT